MRIFLFDGMIHYCPLEATRKSAKTPKKIVKTNHFTGNEKKDQANGRKSENGGMNLRGNRVEREKG